MAYLYNLRRRLQMLLILLVILLAFSVSSIWIAYVSRGGEGGRRLCWAGLRMLLAMSAGATLVCWISCDARRVAVSGSA